MERKRKLIITIIISIYLLLGIFTSEIYAVNEVNNTTNTTNTTQQTNTTQTNTTQTNSTQSSTTTNQGTTTQRATKSSNANLSDLGITPHDFTGFRYGTTSYEVVVPEDTEVVEVYAKTQHEKATVTGTGKKTLEKGENKAEVVVTAEDGTKKTYTINIIREIQQEEQEQENSATEETDVEEKKGLVELKIDKLNLEPEFKTDIYEYTVKYIGENTILNIEATATNKDYTIEIVGNKDLQEGENIITILVSDKNGDNVATYQITVNKSLVDEEALLAEESKKREEQKKIILGVAGAGLIFIIIVWAIVRYRRNKILAEEFSGVSFYEKDEEEIPKGLRKKRKMQEEIEDIEEDTDEDYEEDEEDLEENEIEKISKEKLKEKFLDNYTSNEEMEFDNGRISRKQKKRKIQRKEI